MQHNVSERTIYIPFNSIQCMYITDRSKAVFFCGSLLLLFVSDSVSVTFHLTCVHIIFSSVSVAE